jgi:5-methylcytosine-specific restriction endonuclease McrA
MGTHRDITEQKFGRLTAIRVVGKSIARRESIWLCKCDCGIEKPIQLGSLRSGQAKSCGCLQQEIRSESHKNHIAGLRSGKLIAISPTNRKVRGVIMWLCQCDCGKKKEVSSYNIKSGHTISCGCARLKRDRYRKKEIREKKLFHQNNRRAKQLNAGGTFTTEQVKELYEKQHGNCAICFNGVEYEEIARDHVMPLAKGGSNDISNIQILCYDCNSKKNSKDPIQYANQLGRLV